MSAPSPSGPGTGSSSRPDWHALLTLLQAAARDAGPHADDELVQETVGRILRAWARGSRPRDWRSYALGALRNVRRTRSRTEPPVDPTWLAQRARTPPSAPPDEPLAHWFRRELLPRLVAELGPRHRRLLEAIVTRPTIRDVAASLDMEPSNVRRGMAVLARKARKLAARVPPPGS